MNELYQLIEAKGELAEYILAQASAGFNLRKSVDVFDLYVFYALLVSTGMNKNTDFFDPQQLWAARHSPEDKPVNIGHKQNKIVGHILENVVVGEDLKPIPETTSVGDLPYKLHIITACVLYRVWESSAMQDEINAIIDKIAKGKAFCSMECLFKDFSFLLMNSKGEQKILPRNDETKVLTRHLRQYGGSGKIYDYTLGRVLEQITFSAVGIVDNPANPVSVISNSLNLFDGHKEVGYTKIDTISHGENIMADMQTDMASVTHDIVKQHPLYKDLEDKHNRLASDHASLNARCEDMKSKLDNIHQHTMADEVAALQTQVAGLNESLIKAKEETDKAKKDKEDMDEACTTAKASVIAMQGENEAMKATLEAYKKAERSSARVAALMSVDTSLTKDQAMQTVAKFDELSDESFTATIALVGNYSSKAPKEVTPETVLSNVKAEVDAQYGVIGIDINKTAADVTTWWKSQKPETNTKGA